MEVKSAFLHGDLDEEVYTTMPSRFKATTSNKICKLRKFVCGLKKAMRQWFTKLSSKLSEYGFIRLYVDYSLLTYRMGDVYMALLVHVDDMILTRKDSEACAKFKQYLISCFHIKDLFPLKYFLGIEVAQSP